MWRDICLHNRQAILKSMDRYVEDMHELYTAVETRDSDTLLDIFSRAKRARDRFAD